MGPAVSQKVKERAAHVEVCGEFCFGTARAAEPALILSSHPRTQHNKSEILIAERRGRRGSIVGCATQCLGRGLLRRDCRFSLELPEQERNLRSDCRSAWDPASSASLSSYQV